MGRITHLNAKVQFNIPKTTWCNSDRLGGALELGFGIGYGRRINP
jgi:hypothetical protein